MGKQKLITMGSDWRMFDFHLFMMKTFCDVIYFLVPFQT